MNIYLYEYTYPRESNSRVTEPIHMQFYSFYPRETESIHMQFYSRETELIHVQFYTYTIINSTFERLNLQILEFYTYTILPLREHIQFYFWETEPADSWILYIYNSTFERLNLQILEIVLEIDEVIICILPSTVTSLIILLKPCDTSLIILVKPTTLLKNRIASVKFQNKFWKIM